jgi:hypothetical protein
MGQWEFTCENHRSKWELSVYPAKSSKDISLVDYVDNYLSLGRDMEQNKNKTLGRWLRTAT